MKYNAEYVRGRVGGSYKLAAAVYSEVLKLSLETMPTQAKDETWEIAIKMINNKQFFLCSRYKCFCDGVWIKGEFYQVDSVDCLKRDCRDIVLVNGSYFCRLFSLGRCVERLAFNEFLN